MSIDKIIVGLLAIGFIFGIGYFLSPLYICVLFDAIVLISCLFLFAPRLLTFHSIGNLKKMIKLKYRYFVIPLIVLSVFLHLIFKIEYTNKEYHFYSLGVVGVMWFGFLLKSIMTR